MPYYSRSPQSFAWDASTSPSNGPSSPDRCASRTVTARRRCGEDVVQRRSSPLERPRRLTGRSSVKTWSQASSSTRSSTRSGSSNASPSSWRPSTRDRSDDFDPLFKDNGAQAPPGEWGSRKRAVAAGVHERHGDGPSDCRPTRRACSSCARCSGSKPGIVRNWRSRRITCGSSSTGRGCRCASVSSGTGSPTRRARRVATHDAPTDAHAVRGGDAACRRRKIVA